jgi:hypothetical protein
VSSVEGRDWTLEFPCDNEIVLHVLSVWLSQFLDGTNKDQRTSLVFRENHVSVGPEKQGEGDYIFICTEGWDLEQLEKTPGKPKQWGILQTHTFLTRPWSVFFVRTNMGPNRCDEKFWAGVGRDALYEVLVMFVWIIKHRKEVPWRLDWISLKDEEIAFNQVFQDEE